MPNERQASDENKHVDYVYVDGAMYRVKKTKSPIFTDLVLHFCDGRFVSHYVLDNVAIISKDTYKKDQLHAQHLESRNKELAEIVHKLQTELSATKEQCENNRMLVRNLDKQFRSTLLDSVSAATYRHDLQQWATLNENLRQELSKANNKIRNLQSELEERKTDVEALKSALDRNSTSLTHVLSYFISMY